MNQVEPIVFISPLSQVAKRTRINKQVAVARRRGYSVLFLGWERIIGESLAKAAQAVGVEERIIVRGGGYGGAGARMRYPLWMINVFLSVLRLGRRRIVFALGWESAFPAVIAAFFTRSMIVFDDADRFSMVIRLPGPFLRILQALERWTSRRCRLHLVPGLSRYDWFHDGMIVLRNTPLQSDFRDAKTAAPPRPDHQLVLYANGWVGETRGAPIFLRALELAAERGVDVKMVIAGRVDGPSSVPLLSHPAAIMCGEVPQNVALGWYTACDAVMTYYDPAVSINRMAESNKWGDAVFLGCPIIVNSEVETAHAFVESGAAFSVPYCDAEKLVDLWAEMVGNPSMLKKAQDALINFQADYPPFDTQFDSILDHLIQYAG